MNTKLKNIPIKYSTDQNIHVSLKWFRGAGRYNNGATIYGRKYMIRLLFNRLKSN